MNGEKHRCNFVHKPTPSASKQDKHRCMHLLLIHCWEFCQHVRLNHISISYPDVQSREHPRASPPQLTLGLKAICYPTHHYHLFMIHQLEKKDNPYTEILHNLSPDLFNLKGIVTTRPASHLPFVN